MSNQVVETGRKALNHSERFTNKVLKEFGGSVAGDVPVTIYQRGLIQGYFIAIDRMLKLTEEKRISKNQNNKDPKYNNDLAYCWENVDLNQLALDVVHYARMGLDMMQSNHLSAIPYKNNGTGKYNINLMPGYNGIQYISEKYALDHPKAVTIELVYSTDSFKPIKKSITNAVESYEFEINNPFDRGEIIGGFGYIQFEDEEQNKLVIMTRKDFEKRKPEYASVEFWGGTTKVWKDKKQVEVEKEGWFEEMCLKTLKRAVYSPKNIPLDPKKIDDAYQYMKLKETQIAEQEITSKIEEADGRIIDIETGEVFDSEDEVISSASQPSFSQLKIEKVEDPVSNGPDF